jgi:NAD+-dependent protein deacetylase sirtuin 2
LLTADPSEREAIRSDPTVALEHNMFLQNPLPLLELQREFILGTYERKWKATIAHRFVELLHSRTAKLVRLYTQNIDGLEDQCSQLPHDKVIAVHGSMDRAQCERCHSNMEYDNFCRKVKEQIKDLSRQDVSAPDESTAILCPTCGYNAMKPSIVLFRSSLPRVFFESVPNDVKDIDLLIIMGTSLRVAPANSIVWRVPKTCLRVLVNREEVGDHLGMFPYDNFDDDDDNECGEEEPTNGCEENINNDTANNNARKRRGRDYFASGECDAVLLQLIDKLGWIDELQPLLDQQQLPESSANVLREYIKSNKVSPD